VSYLDHHYTHQLSTSVKKENNLVLDGYAEAGGAPYFGLVNQTRINELSPAHLLNCCVRAKQFDGEQNIRHFTYVNGWFNDLLKSKDKMSHEDWKALVSYIDMPGKMMGLQAYGKTNKDKLIGWTKLKQFRSRLIMATLVNTLKPDITKDLITTVHSFGEHYVQQFALGMQEFTYSGGLAQNVVWNRALIDAGKKPHIDPWAYDGGCSIGALNYLLDMHDIERYADWVQDDEAPDDEPDGGTLSIVAELIGKNKVVGWYQGNGEVGPRALGRRSILFNPANEKAKDKVNKIKQREWWRPFGASVLEEKASKFFDLSKSRHMLFNSKVLYPGIPGVTHIDGTCRHQTVPDEDTPMYWFLTYLELETGLPIILNTSLNAKGKPLCSTIEQAIDLFKNTEMDALCVGNTLYQK
jgi:carbamoyltransferase